MAFRMSYQRRKDQRPAEIRDSALDVFAELGFAATNMSDIATRARVSRPTLYRYYPNKEAIFEALICEKMGPMIAEIRVGLDQFDGTASALLEHVLRRFFAQASSPEVSRIIRLMITEGPQFPELAAFYKAELVDPGRMALTRILERGVQTKEFRASVTCMDPRVFLAPALLAVVWASLFGTQEPMDMQNLIDSHVALAIRGVAAV